MERMNGEIKDREKVMRGLERKDSPILTGYQLFHNYIRPHKALDYKTPARYLAGRTIGLNLVEPSPILERRDNRAIREAILRLTDSEARTRGIGKSTLHYLRKKARANQAFQVYRKVESKLT
jgi:hypothetical protein